MSDVIEEIKRRLTVQDVIARSGYSLKAHGYKLQCEEHESLTVNPRKQVWSWWSQEPGQQQRALGGDLFSWLAFKRFGRPKVDGEQWQEVLKEAAALAGVELPESNSPEGKRRSERQALERQKRETLAAYLEVARQSWTPMDMERARQIGRNDAQGKPGKVYLTKDAIERWSLGCAPKLPALLKAGISEKDLRVAGLLRDRRDESSYLFFQDCIIIPWMDNGEVMFLSMRRLGDMAPDGTLLDKNKKALSMHAPLEDGTRGCRKPAAFNLDTLADALKGSREVLIVEGPLDAVACEERGHAAIALGCKAPPPELIERLKYYPGLQQFVALDGTDDVTALGRARVAGMLGIYTRVCELPAEKDPDDLSGEELTAVKAAAVDALSAWCNLVEVRAEI